MWPPTTRTAKCSAMRTSGFSLRTSSATPSTPREYDGSPPGAADQDPRCGHRRPERPSALRCGPRDSRCGQAALRRVHPGNTTVVRLVRLTKTHDVATDDPNGQVLCDADLGILAADKQRYAEYTQGIRREYAHVGDEDFRRGRVKILRDLLAMPALFRTSFAKQHWENSAHANVARELIELES